MPVIPGALSAEKFLPMRALWPQVAAELAQWPGTAICDLGRLQPGHAGLPVAKAADVVVLLALPTLEGLFRLRDRVGVLAHLLGDPGQVRSPIAVVVRAPSRHSREAVDAVARTLQSAGSPIPVAGAIIDDPDGAQALWAGRSERRLTRSSLVASATALAGRLLDGWPQLWDVAGGPAASGVPDPTNGWARSVGAVRGPS